MDSNSKKIIILKILDILKQHSDANHKLSQKDILDYLKKDYNIIVNRKTVLHNLDDLIIDGTYDIQYNEETRGSGKNKQIVKKDFWYCSDFEDSELRLIIDSLLFSKYIPYNQCKNIIKKISNLTSEYFKSRIKYVKTVQSSEKRNYDVFLTIDVVDEAIKNNKQIQFNYYNYNIRKELEPRLNNDGSIKQYIVNPFFLVATNSRYYLVCNNKNKFGVNIYVVDRIKNAKILDEEAISKTEMNKMLKQASLPKYVIEHIYMAPGDSINVSFEFDKKQINAMIEWFGTDIILKEKDQDTYIAKVFVNKEAIKYFAMQYSQFVKITQPKQLVSEMREIARKAYELYKY